MTMRDSAVLNRPAPRESSWQESAARRIPVGQKGSNLSKRKADILQERDQRQPVDGVRMVTAPAAQPRRRLEEANRLVITQCGGMMSTPLRQRPDSE